MSYARARFHFTGLGLAMTVDTRTGDDTVRALQTDLARLGFLQSDLSAQGIDGKWGRNTEAALRSAASRVGYSGTPFTRSGSTVTVPDELIALLRAAGAESGSVPDPARAPGSTVLQPTGTRLLRRTPSSLPGGEVAPRESETPSEQARPETEETRSSTILGVRKPIFYTGVAVAGVGLLALVYMAASPAMRKSTAAMTANRNRRRR